MELGIEKEWCIRMAWIEGGAEIAAGRLAIDPVFDGEAIPAGTSDAKVRCRPGRTGEPSAQAPTAIAARGCSRNRA